MYNISIFGFVGNPYFCKKLFTLDNFTPPKGPGGHPILLPGAFWGIF
jgi:hypothetical protein